MSTDLLPVRSDLSAYSFSVSLSDVNYIIHFRYNDRRALWSMDIHDASDVPVMNGINLLSHFNLIGNITNKRLPTGDFILIDETEQGLDASEFTLGNDVKLIYATEQ